MKSRVNVTAAARRDLREILILVSRENRTAAQRLADKFQNVLDLINRSPELGRRRPELGNVRSFAVSSYVIFYRLIEKGVEILRVLHGARDVDSAFNEPEPDRGAGNDE